MTSQLDLGVRSLNLRPSLEKSGRLLSRHGPVLVPAPLSELINEAVAWAREHPLELVLLHIATCTGPASKESATNSHARDDDHSHAVIHSSSVATSAAAITAAFAALPTNAPGTAATRAVAVRSAVASAESGAGQCWERTRALLLAAGVLQLPYCVPITSSVADVWQAATRLSAHHKGAVVAVEKHCVEVRSIKVEEKLLCILCYRKI